MGYRQARRLLEPLSQDAIGRAFAAVDLPEHLASACLRGRQQAMPAVVVRCFSKQMQFQRVYAEYDLGLTASPLWNELLTLTAIC